MSYILGTLELAFGLIMPLTASLLTINKVHEHIWVKILTVNVVWEGNICFTSAYTQTPFWSYASKVHFGEHLSVSTQKKTNI